QQERDLPERCSRPQIRRAKQLRQSRDGQEEPDQGRGFLHVSSLLTSSETGRAGSSSARSCSTARRPPRSRTALSPCSSVNSASAASRRARTREAVTS